LYPKPATVALNPNTVPLRTQKLNKDDRRVPSIISKIPAARYGTNEQVARLALSLTHDESSCFTGPRQMIEAWFSSGEELNLARRHRKKKIYGHGCRNRNAIERAASR
jgi:hypothetical protein